MSPYKPTSRDLASKSFTCHHGVQRSTKSWRQDWSHLNATVSVAWHRTPSERHADAGAELGFGVWGVQLWGRGWKLGAGEIFFWVARCFWCVLVHCEEEINLVIIHLTCLKHVYFRLTCVGLSLANCGFGLTGRQIWLFCCWTNNAVLFLKTAYFVHNKSKTVTDANITTWPVLTRSVSNSLHVMI